MAKKRWPVTKHHGKPRPMHEGRATVDAAGYSDYINSDAWREVRRRYWASKMPKDCYVCGRSRHPGMHLHHRTYKNLGNERLMDLVPVCPECHEEIHRLCRELRRSLWHVTKIARKRHHAAHRQIHAALVESAEANESFGQWARSL
jgi:5-methylcytosine-specific restriction endonuclease McrA